MTTVKNRASASPAKNTKKSVKNIAGNLTANDYEIMLDEQHHSFTMQISEKEVEIDRLKTTVVALNGKCNVVDDHAADVSSTRSALLESENSRVKLQERIQITSITIQTEAVQKSNFENEQTTRINDLMKQLEQYKQFQYQKDQKARQELDAANKEKEDVRRDLGNQLEQVRRNLTNELEQVRKDLGNQLEQVRQEKQQEKVELLNQMDQMRRQKDSRIAQLEDDQEKLRQETSSTIYKQEIEIRSLTQKTLLQETTITSLQEKLFRFNDIENQLKVSQAQNQQSFHQKEKMQKEVEQATDYVLELEEKVYKANKTQLELLKQLKDCEVEIDTLKSYIVDLKQRIAVYIPVKQDQIDKQLAEFINNYPERAKLKIMFMRESEGVYQFGTKRVAVKVEKDSIKIRVGGGFLSIDEFLDQYTPIELDKLKRKDPLKRYSERVALQSTIVNAGVRETSPIRSPARANSPGRNSPARSQNK